MTYLHGSEQSSQHPCVLVFVSKMERIALSMKAKQYTESILSVTKFNTNAMLGVISYFLFILL